MNNQISKEEGISICSNSGCIHARGVYADRIVTAIVVMVLLVGIGALLKSTR